MKIQTMNKVEPFSAEFALGKEAGDTLVCIGLIIFGSLRICPNRVDCGHSRCLR